MATDASRCLVAFDEVLAIANAVSQLRGPLLLTGADKMEKKDHIEVFHRVENGGSLAALSESNLGHDIDSAWNVPFPHS